MRQTLTEDSLCARCCDSCLGVSAKPHHHLWDGHDSFHFTDEHTEAQGGWIRCLGSYSQDSASAPAPLLCWERGRLRGAQLLSPCSQPPCSTACGWESARASKVSTGRKRAGPWRTPGLHPHLSSRCPPGVLPQCSPCPRLPTSPSLQAYPSRLLRGPPVLTHSESNKLTVS